MKTRNKALLLTLCALMLVAASVLGTMAYLTSTDEVKNTFTVGQVKITLDEAKVNGNGEPINEQDAVVTELAAAERVNENSYKLMPGHEYTKDPTVTVLNGSEESYVRMLVTVTFGEKLSEPQLATELDGIFTGTDTRWIRESKKVDSNVTVGEGSDAKTYGTVITYEYRYTEAAVSAGDTDDEKLPALFTGIKVPDDWTNDDLAAFGDIQINIVAQAIQADGFANADAAWEAFPAD